MDTLVFFDVGSHFLGYGIVMAKNSTEYFFHVVGFLGSIGSIWEFYKCFGLTFGIIAVKL